MVYLPNVTVNPPSEEHVLMLYAYRLIYLKSSTRSANALGWEQPRIHHLVVNARSFKTTGR
jgi:hypothetical protein